VDVEVFDLLVVYGSVVLCVPENSKCFEQFSVLVSTLDSATARASIIRSCNLVIGCLNPQISHTSSTF
jgi:hypothetical protein